MKIISVIPLKKSILKSNLTYFTNLDVSAGDIVSIPLRNKKALGLVVSSEDLSQKKSNIKNMSFNLRKVTETKGSSIFLKEYLETIFDTCEYFAQNKNSSIISLIPNIFLEKYDEISKIENGEKNNEKKDRNLKAEKLLFQYPLEDRISIYKTLIRESFAKKKSIFIILPTELNIEKFTTFLSKGIKQFTFSMHSRNSAKENIKNYKKIVSSTHPLLVICTPPFLSIPRKDIGTIILENENSNAYKMIARPYFDLRIFVEIFASKINAKLIMADNLLRFETLERREIDNINVLHPLSFRTDSANKIEVLSPTRDIPHSVTDRRELTKKRRKFKVLKDESIEEIKSTLKNKKNVFIFSLRKGLATITLCNDCGNNITCDKCGSVLVLYTSKDGNKRMFACNKCSSKKDPSITCDICDSWNLIPLGIGTDTVYKYVKEIFPKTKVLKLDKEIAKTKKGAQKIIEEFENENGAILIGTEMALFYLKNKVNLSIIASFDSLWSIPSFKMGEKILKILLEILEKTEDKFIIQTKNEKDEAILSIQKENFLSFVREELKDRELLGYPPFKTFIKITYLGNKEETTKTREFLNKFFKDYNPEIFGGFIPKRKDKYSTNVLIKMDTKQWSLPSISIGASIDEVLLSKLLSLPPIFRVSVNPEDLL